MSKIETLIKARYPILYIISNEELRTQEIIVQIAEKLKKRAYEWTCTTGLAPAGTPLQSQKNRNPGSKQPLVALDLVISKVEPAVFMFKDLHPFLMKTMADNFTVTRKLKDIALHLKNSDKTIVLVSPILEIPAELEKEITVLNHPLPAREELAEVLDRIIASTLSPGGEARWLDTVCRERVLHAALGLTIGEAENVFTKILRNPAGELMEDSVAEVLFEKQQIIRKSGLLEHYATEESFESVGGLAVLKEWLTKRALAFTDKARAFGLPAPKGILLLGVQGCGKSLCAKAVSNLWQLPLLRFDMGRMFSAYIGSSEENVRRAITVAESVAPAIVWVDEIDKAFAGLRSNGDGDNGTTARVLGTFLTWLSEKTAPVFVVATANELSHLPPELLRKGRLDEIFFVDLPGHRERVEIFRIHLRKRGRDETCFDLNALAAASDNFSGAEIEEVVNSALYDAFYTGNELTTAHLLAALAQTVPLARTIAEQITELRKWADGRARDANVALRNDSVPAAAGKAVESVSA